MIFWDTKGTGLRLLVLLYTIIYIYLMQKIDLTKTFIPLKILFPNQNKLASMKIQKCIDLSDKTNRTNFSHTIFYNKL